MTDLKHPTSDDKVTRTSRVSSFVDDMTQSDPNGKVADILFGNDRQDSLIPPGGEDPPPEFTPYEAEYELTDDGDIVSHDPHLNEDGEALYRFLLSHAQQPPTYVLRISGTHTELRTRRVQRTDSDGHTHWHTETYTETVLDFMFAIDLAQYVVAGPVHWSVSDEVPAYRGEMVKEVHAKPGVEQEGMGQRGARGRKGKCRDLEGGALDERMRRPAEDAEAHAAEAWEQTRIAKGLPPWVGRDTSSDAIEANMRVLMSSKTVREWADEYCASRKVLKEFMFEKVIYGWDVATLSAAITTAIRATPYVGNIGVSFEYPARRRVYVRPDNTLSRILDNSCCKVLLWLVLAYPLIWLWRRFSRRGGGRWEICGAAYALKTKRVSRAYEEAGDGKAEELPEEIPGASGSTTKIVGLREGEFFQRWEGAIKRGVVARWQLSEPLQTPPEWNDAHVPRNPALALDGYVHGRTPS